MDTGIKIMNILASNIQDEGTMERLFDLDLQLLVDALFVLAAVFVLFIVLSYFLFNPAREFLNKRKERIKAEIDESKKSFDDANSLKEEYEKKLNEINKEAEVILAQARQKAIKNENDIIAKAKEEASSIIDRAEAEALLEKKKLADEVKTQMIDVAAVLATKMVSSKLDMNVQNELIQDTLDEIGENTWLS